MQWKRGMGAGKLKTTTGHFENVNENKGLDFFVWNLYRYLWFGGTEGGIPERI